MWQYSISPYSYGGNSSDYFVGNPGTGIQLSKVNFQRKCPTEFEFKHSHLLTEFCRLYNIELPAWPPKNYSNIIKQLSPELLDQNHIEWWKVMGFKRYVSELKHMASTFEEAACTYDLAYWSDLYSRFFYGLFAQMQQTHIDIHRYNKYKNEANASQLEILESFRPNDFGIASKPIYSGTETRTGRLKVIQGPNILHLKKEYRDILTSSHGEKGKIVYLDFASLEPRILLSVSNPSLIGSLPQDIYSKMLSDLNLSEKIPRTVAKTAILSILYGQSESNTVKTLSNYIGSPEDFLNLVTEYFGIEALKEKLAIDLQKTSGRYITNYYGRPVFCEDTKPYALLNYYVQSTAVDVAMLGFLNIITRLKDNNLTDMIRPIFILHDALFLDIHEDAYHVIPKLEKLGSTGIKGFKNVDFWLRME